MVRRALSDQVKRQKKAHTHDRNLRHAATAYLAAKERGEKKSLRDVAADFSVSKSSLQRLVDDPNHRTILEFNGAKKRLKSHEEDMLADFIVESAEHGFPLTHKEVVNYATVILQSRLGTECEPLGSRWIFRFLERHHNQLQTFWSKPLDTQRARSLNPTAVKSFYDIIEEFVVKLGVRPEDLYGMDESGFPTAYSGKERVVGARGTKTQHKQGGGDRENVTALVTICADGTTLRPMIIFKGKNFMSRWNDNNVTKAHISHSDKGWTDGEMGLEWLRLFHEETKEKANGRPRVLLLDGHSSHYTLPFLSFAKDNNIILIGYPPHCTHALQGLDVVCFAKMKEEFKKEITAFEDAHQRPVTKADFTGLFGHAYLRAFDVTTVKAAFEATGVSPFNRNIITEKQMKPSAPTSVKGGFPLPQPSPVRAVMAAFNTNPPTAFDTSPSTHTAARTLGTTTEPSTPTPKRILDENIDPSLFTPSKRMRTLYSTLSSTSSGSFLVSKQPLTSATPIFTPILEGPPSIPLPDWSLSSESSSSSLSWSDLKKENDQLRENLRLAHTHHNAQNMIVESSHAQMVVQNLHLVKLNGALNKKESRKKNERALLFDGKAKVLTSDEFQAGLQALADKREAATAQKAKNSEARALRKEAVARVEEEWKRIKEAHEADVRDWDEECQKLAAEGVPRKEWPKKPVRARKPQLATSSQEQGDGGEEVNDEEDGDNEDDE